MKRVEIEKTVTYIIDEEARKVKAIIRDVKYDAINSIAKSFNDVNCQIIGPIENYYLNSTYTGVAICCDQDNFDVEVGKAIARKRAIVKYNKAKINRLQKFYKDVNTIHETLSKTISYTENKLNKISNEIDKLEK